MKTVFSSRDLSLLIASYNMECNEVFIFKLDHEQSFTNLENVDLKSAIICVGLHQ